MITLRLLNGSVWPLGVSALVLSPPTAGGAVTLQIGADRLAPLVGAARLLGGAVKLPASPVDKILEEEPLLVTSPMDAGLPRQSV